MVGDFVIFLILGRHYPGYSHLRDTISTLGMAKSPVQHQLSVWLVMLGFCFIGFAVGQGSGFRIQDSGFDQEPVSEKIVDDELQQAWVLLPKFPVSSLQFYNPINRTPNSPNGFLVFPDRKLARY